MNIGDLDNHNFIDEPSLSFEGAFGTVYLSYFADAEIEEEVVINSHFIAYLMDENKKVISVVQEQGAKRAVERLYIQYAIECALKDTGRK